VKRSCVTGTLGISENGDRGFRQFISMILLVIPLLISAACGTAPLPVDTPLPRTIADGVYEASYGNWPNSATVRVSVKDGRITDIVVVRHVASWIGKKAETVIPARIVSAQSTRVDAVSGATNSSRVIMNAVQSALDKGHIPACKP
jgi:uncharacterized protein with FMN-binding domain